MQKIRIIIIALIGTVFFMSQSAMAQSVGQQGQLKPNDNMLYAAVTMDCLAVKLKLTKVHEDDGLLRVTAGQSYDHIANKLMGRLNSKIAEQRLDGGQLIDTAAQFDSQVNEFRVSYQTYEVAMSDLLKMDCRSQQQSFYAALESTRSKREEMTKTVKNLDETVQKYLEKFLTFKRLHLENLEQKKHDE